MNRLNKVFSIILVLCFMTTSVVINAQAEEQEITTVSALSEIMVGTEAEYDGLTIGENQAIGTNIGIDAAGGWARYDNVDFGNGDIMEFGINMGSHPNYTGGVVTVYIDSISSNPIANVTVNSTGGWTTLQWHMTPVNNSEIVGVHSVFLSFGKRNMGNAVSFKFTKYTGAVSTEKLPSDIEGTEFEEQFIVLSKLGLIDFEEGKSYSVNKTATGADLIKTAARLIKHPEDENSVNDLANRLGIILEDAVNYDMAAKVAVYILGYNEIADLQTDYAAYCRQIVERNRIFEGIKLNDGMLSKGNLIQLEYNLLDKDVAAFSSIGPDWVKKDIRPTVLSYYHSIYLEEGIVEGNVYTELTGESSVGEGEVLIDGVKYAENDTNASDLLGRGVKFYYTQENSSKRELFYISEYDNKIVKISDEDIISYNNMVLEYYDENQKNKKIRVNQAVDFIYNRSALLDYDKTIFEKFDGYVIMIDNDSNGVYDVIEMSDTYSIVVETLANDIVYGKVGSKTINLNDGVFLVKDQYGNRLDESELRKLGDGNVLVVAESTNAAGEKIFDITIVRKNVTGTVTTVIDDLIKVNGKDYVLSKAVQYLTNDKKITAGSRVILYLNAEGEVVLVSFTAQTEVYGYLIGVAKETGFNAPVSVKIFTRDGAIAEYQCDNSVRIDNKAYNKSSEIYNLINTRYCGGMLIVFSLNDNGKVCSIDFPYDKTGDVPVGKETWEKENSIHKVYSPAAEVAYSSNAQSFSGFAPINLNSIVFCIPPSGNERYYIVEKASSLFVNSTRYKVKAYSSDVNSLSADVYILDQFADDNEFLKTINSIRETSNDNVSYICGFASVWDSEKNEAVTEMTYYSAGVLKSAFVDNAIMESLPDLGVGDSARMKVDADGYVVNIVKMFDFKSKTIDYTNASQSFTSTGSCRMGTVEKKSGAYFKLAEYDEIYNGSTANVYVYEEKSVGYPITVGTIDDIIDATKIKGGSQIVLNAYAGKTIAILVIK